MSARVIDIKTRRPHPKPDSALPYRDPGPMSRFRWMTYAARCESTLGMFLQRIADGESFRQICRSFGLPRKEMREWLKLNGRQIVRGKEIVPYNYLVSPSRPVCGEVKAATGKPHEQNHETI